VPADTNLAAGRPLFRHSAIKPRPLRPSAVSGQHVKASRRKGRGWNLFDKRYWPCESLRGGFEEPFQDEQVEVFISPTCWTTTFISQWRSGSPSSQGTR
jgi:hypothetical protein